MRSRALTETLSRPEVSLLVEEFRCQTHSIENQIGAKASHRLWRVGALGHGRDVTESRGNSLCELSQDDTTKSEQSERSIERALRSITMEVFTDPGVGGVKAAVLGTQVMIKAEGTQLFPDKALARGKLHDDWMREWKYRGLYPAIGFVRPGEMWVPGTIPTDVPSQVGDAVNLVQTYMLGDGKLKTMHEVMVGTERYPCVLTKQWLDGCFELTAFKPNNQGVAKYTAVEFPTMHKSNIFLTSTGENIQLPDCIVSFQVPRANPQSACVTLSGESFLEHLGRASPKASDGPLRRVVVDCPKQSYVSADVLAKQMLQAKVTGFVHTVEKPVEINVHTLVWEHFLSGEVRRGDTYASRLQRCWTVQLGPFATHTLRLVKKSHVSAVMTLYVDDEVLVECSSSDLGGSSDLWRCKFCFVGERQMDFRVFEETKDGVPLDSKSEITKSFQYRHVIEVAYLHRKIDNLAEATVAIDGVPYQGLPCIIEERSGQPNLSITPSALKAQFGVQIPKKVAPQDTRGIARQIGSNVVKQAGGWSAIGVAASKTIEDVGANLSKLGLSAWEMMFLQRGADTTDEPSQPVSLGDSCPTSKVPDLRDAFAAPGLCIINI